MSILDTCVLINYLNGDIDAKKVIENHAHSKISAITHLEVLAGAKSSTELKSAHRILAHFQLIPVTKAIAQLAAQLRRESKIKTPDAIVLATAIHLETKLITFDKRFPKNSSVEVY